MAVGGSEESLLTNHVTCAASHRYAGQAVTKVNILVLDIERLCI